MTRSSATKSPAEHRSALESRIHVGGSLSEDFRILLTHAQDVFAAIESPCISNMCSTH